ncbi:MAG: TonB-dependent receptor [Ferruginibacter sp.]
MRRVFFLILVSIIFSYNSKAQSVSGTIVTVDGSPASQVNVELHDLKMYTTTDDNGYFIFRHVPDGKYTVIASYTGLETKIFPVEVNKKSVISNIILAENTKQLDAVIVKSAKGLNEVTTSAGKIAIKPMDLPQSIVVLGENVIKQQQSQRLSDVIKNVNGVYL